MDMAAGVAVYSSPCMRRAWAVFSAITHRDRGLPIGEFQGVRVTWAKAKAKENQHQHACPRCHSPAHGSEASWIWDE
jgi:hypothetical protein